MLVKDSKNKIKVGDWVRTNGSTFIKYNDFFLVGEIGEIQDSCFFIWQNDKTGNVGSVLPSTKGYKGSWQVNFDNSLATIEILKSSDESNKPKKPIMRTLSTMIKKILDKDIQILIKAEYINGDLELTEKGKSALNALLFQSNKEELVKLAEEELKESKA